MRNSVLAIMAALALAACGTTKLSDPTFEFPTPPAVLMEPPGEPELINDNYLKPSRSSASTGTRPS